VTGESKNDAVGAFGVCEWSSPTVSGYVARLTVGPAKDYELLKAKNAEPLAGLGDEAWISPLTTAGDFDIGVKAGDVHVLIFFTGPTPVEQGKAMAAAILIQL
jgi:hypothetical protein